MTTVHQNYDFGLGDSLAVDLGVANADGSFSLGYLTDNFLIDLELSALESDGYGEIVSQPKVLTGDKQQAVIKSGTEIAFKKPLQVVPPVLNLKRPFAVGGDAPDNAGQSYYYGSAGIPGLCGCIYPTGEPSIDITQIQTQALVGNGQTLVLGRYLSRPKKLMAQKRCHCWVICLF